MDALKLMKYRMGILDDGGELDEMYLFNIEAARAKIKEQNGKEIDENNEHELDVLVNLAVELTRNERREEPKYLTLDRLSLMINNVE